MLNIANHQLSSNEKNTSHRQNDYHQKYKHREIRVVKYMEKENFVYCWWDWVDADTMNNTMQVPQKLKVELLYAPTISYLGVFLKKQKQ